ncbi:MAG: hypothetical protein ACR2MD_06165, partial [Aridibacter sp.]
MNEVIVYKPSPVKTLSVSRAPLRELLNFLTYGQHPELLNERGRKQPFPALDKIPKSVKDLQNVLKAEECDKNEKLFFDCQNREHHIAVLLHNEDAQFWIHYFSCGIGLVNLSFFSHFTSAEGALFNGTRNVTHSHEYQWFTHDLDPKLFSRNISEKIIAESGSYFVERVNSTLISPYTIYYESVRIKEPYKFVAGSFERLKEVLIWTRFVCEGLKLEREPNGRTWVSPHITIICGNLRSKPTLEYSTETFINAVGALAVRENAPFTVLREGFGRRAGGECYDWARKNKHRMFLNLEKKNKDVPVRKKIAARICLVNWLREKGKEGERIIKYWKLE